MKSTREQYEPWLRDYVRKRCPEAESPLLAAINAFDAIQNGKQVSPELLEPIVEAASHSRRVLFNTATSLLARLTAEYAEARDSVAGMAKNSRSHIRFNSMLCLGKATPRPFALQLLRQGLRDKSANVRRKAADQALGLRIRAIVPDLAEAAGKETNAKAKQTIEFSLALLRNGYILAPAPNDGFDLTTCLESGGIVGRRVNRSDIESGGVQAIIAELQKSLSWLNSAKAMSDQCNPFPTSQ